MKVAVKNKYRVSTWGYGIYYVVAYNKKQARRVFLHKHGLPICSIRMTEDHSNEHYERMVGYEEKQEGKGKEEGRGV